MKITTLIPAEDQGTSWHVLPIWYIVNYFIIYKKLFVTLLILKSCKTKRMKLITKTTISAVLLISMAQLISAQTVGKAAWMLGGSVGFSSTKLKDAENSTTQIYLTPNVGYFIMDDLAIGLDVAFYSESTDGDSQSNFGFGPYARYYFTDPFFIQAGYAFNASPFDSQLFQSGGGSTFQASVGYSLFLGNNVAIEPSIFINIYSEDDDSVFNSFTQFGLNVGIQAFANHHHGME